MQGSHIQATVIAEYPVFVGANGVEVPNTKAERGRAQRRLIAELGNFRSLGALSTDGDYDQTNNPKICGECGSAHANGNVSVSDSPTICEDLTGSGSSFDPGGASVGGLKSGGVDEKYIPVINPLDDIFVPPIEALDTTSWSSLPALLRCGPPTATDPGNAKYFALVAGGGKGYVYKAYWDTTNDRWAWKMIDDLDDGTDVLLDDCGRAPGDPNYGSAVPDLGTDSFYGFKGTGESTSPCATCGTAGADKSLCDLKDNDFNRNGGYYEWNAISQTGTWRSGIPGSGIPALPGSFESDGVRDVDIQELEKILASQREHYERQRKILDQ